MSSRSWEDYAYTVLIVFCFMIKDGKILLIRRANEPYKGEVTVPGGRKQKGESLREACAREMKEETGYTLKDMQFAGVLHAYRPGGNIEFVSNYFVCRDFDGELKPSEEGELLWVDIGESLTLPGIHPYYVRLLPYIVGGKLPFDISIGNL